jgi:myotubularin-related protein 5/13
LPPFQTSNRLQVCFDIINCRYDDVDCIVPDGFSHLLEEIHRLETELGHLPQKWKVLWDKLELPTADSLTVSV